MQSKLVPGLFIAGELLDLDGPIGGVEYGLARGDEGGVGVRVPEPICSYIPIVVGERR